MGKEGRTFSVLLEPEEMRAFDASLMFTTEPCRSAGRHQDIHVLNDQADAEPETIEAANAGIVYIKYVLRIMFLSQACFRCTTDLSVDVKP